MYTKEKVSLGIACCRVRNNRPEILMVCKRFTYSYNVFVHGGYKSNDTNEIMRLFNGMTTDEKHDILSLNFMQIWYRLWLNRSHKTSHYFMAKNKFENTFLHDKGIKLKRLIANSSNGERVWEIPKGRRSHKWESDIECAVREFSEETGIEKKNYRVALDTRRVHSFIDERVKYTNIYYIAYTNMTGEPRINFSLREQVSEISDIKWMGIEDIRFLDNGQLERFVKPIFGYVKAHMQ